MTTMTQTATKKPTDTAFAPPLSLRSVTLNERHAHALLDILKRTHRASSVEQDWILHTIEVIATQLSSHR